MRSPRDFFRPLALGAPEPLREIPFRPSRMILSESWRSSSDSTAVTITGESVSPHGVLSPKLSWVHPLKSIMPLLATRSLASSYS